MNFLFNLRDRVGNKFSSWLNSAASHEPSDKFNVPGVVTETLTCKNHGDHDQLAMHRWIEGQVDHRYIDGPSGMCSQISRQTYDNVPCFAQQFEEHIINLDEDVSHKIWEFETKNFHEDAYCHINHNGVSLQAIKKYNSDDETHVNIMTIPITAEACVSKLVERMKPPK